MHKMAIIGGGVSGLSLAYYIKKKHPELVVDVFDDSADQVPGGILRSVSHEGATLEAGPPFAIVESPAFLELAEEVGLGDELVKLKSFKVGTWKGGYYQKLPSGLFEFQENILSFCSSGFTSAFALKKSISVWRGLSFFDLLKSTFGQSYAELSGSVFARFMFHCEAEDMVLSGAMPELTRAIESERQLKKALQVMSEGRKRDWQDGGRSSGAGFYSLQKGLGSLTSALFERLQSSGVNFHFAHVKSLRLDKKQYELTTKVGKFGGYEYVFAAIPLEKQAHLWKGLDKDLSEAMEGLDAVSTNVVYMGWEPKKLSASGEGFFVSRKDKLNQYGTLFYSNMFPHLVSDGTFLTRTEFPGDIHLFSDDEIIQMVTQDFKKVLGVEAAPKWFKVFRYQRAFPKYTLEHLDKLDKVGAALKNYENYFSLHPEGSCGPAEVIHRNRDFILQSDFF